MQRCPIKKTILKENNNINKLKLEKKLPYHWENKKHRYHTSKKDTNYNGQKQLQKTKDWATDLNQVAS